ncbi:MAG: OmpA family protein, partial [Deltaproteobacteria bacterium]|nr:OmpA family protein [Deltaproteobacteria bacterium]
WKPTYRVAVGENGKVDLQGWAIVDNTSGEDWKAVQVGVGSSSALSFRYDLHSIRVVHRETLRSNDSFAKAPPLGGSVGRDDPGKEVALAALSDEELARPEGHPDVADSGAYYRAPASVSARAGGGSGQVALAEASTRAARYKVEKAAKVATKDVAAEDRKVGALADQIRNSKRPVVVEGYANAGEADADDKALDRANILRNQLIERGVPPAQVQAVGRGVVSGQKAGVRLVVAPQPAQGGKVEDRDAPPVGESHFDSKLPMTVAKGTSAMVSIVQGQAQGEVVYLYDAESTGGDSRYAFKAVRFKNPTGSTLESGPITVYGAGRFVGEGLAEPIPPGATAVVPFALDRQVVVDRDGSTGDRMSKLVKLSRGALTAEVQHLRTTKLKIANRSHAATTVLVRHTTPKGWTISKGPKAAEVIGESRLFAVEVPAGESRILEIEEATPMTRTVDMRSPVGVEMVRMYLQTAKEDPKVEASIKKLVALFDDMAKTQEQIAHLRERAEEYRLRSDELHDQIFSLKMVKTAGPLMAHLQQKMKEMSDRVQQTTLDVVSAQERLMVAKVKFQDELAELSLDHRPTQAAVK